MVRSDTLPMRSWPRRDAVWLEKGDLRSAGSFASGRWPARQFEAQRPQTLARGRVIGLRIGFHLVHSVEEQAALAGDVVTGHQMQDRIATLLDRRHRRDAAGA